MTSIVIIGAGQAGLTAAVALRERGHEGEIHLVGEEAAAPYSRPPLSKGYLAGAETVSDLLLHSIEGIERAKITLHLGNAVIRVNRPLRAVELIEGTVLTYETLIFATGSAARELRIRGSELRGVHTLRTIGDADALREDLSTGGSTVFIGGGFLGLEVASQAVKNSSVIILEQAPQLLGRVLSFDTAEALTRSFLGRGRRCAVV